MLNLCLTKKSMNRLITNYGDDYSSNGWISHVVFLDSNIMRDGGKLLSFLVSPYLGSHRICPVTNSFNGYFVAGIAFSEVLSPARLCHVWASLTHPCCCALRHRGLQLSVDLQLTAP